MYKKYKLKGLESIDNIDSLQEYISKYKNVNHCSINNGTLFIDTKNKLNETELNHYIQHYNKALSIHIRTKHTHHEHHHDCECGHHHEHEHSHDCGCGHHHEHEHSHDCGCGHHHEHEHSHNCGCGHTHSEDSRTLSNSHKFSIVGLDCANCALKVEQGINSLDYVEEAVLNFTTLTLYVKSDESDLLNKLQTYINKVETGVTISVKTDSKIEKPKLFNIKEQYHLIIGIILFILSLLIKTNISTILILASYLIIGLPVLYKAFRNILKGQIFDENFLMAIATVGAIVIGEYLEAVAVMLFYSIGEIVQAYAVNKTRTSITELMDIKSEEAHIESHNSVTVKKIEDVVIGDIAIVRVGEKIPLDGIIIKGTTTLDTSGLTGESLPKDVTVNDEVLAGMINISEVIHIKVTRPYHESTVAKIIDLIENASSKKAPLERFITRFAKVYTPIVVLMAVLLVVIPMLFIKDAIFNEWLYRSLTFLVVSCPCALVVSIPLGLYAGLGKASQMGALIKGGNYLEFLKNIDTVVFDKTGTLTKGTFSVKEINGDSSILELAAYGESMSNHPISKSIVSYYNKKIDYKRISDYKEIAGKGVQCKIDNIMYYFGNKSFMNDLGINVEEVQTIGTVVYISNNNECLGSIVVSDDIKESSLKGLKYLKDIGIAKTVMLTGDKSNVAIDIAAKLNIDEIYSELLPQDKVYKMEELLKEHHVAFVGDGINDAPVLSIADIGIAMGGVGSDAAIEAADIVLMNDHIDIIGDIVLLSKRVNKILMQNVVFTLFIKLSVLILTIFGYSNMWMGVFADVGVALIAIMNSIRILK